MKQDNVAMICPSSKSRNDDAVIQPPTTRTAIVKSISEGWYELEIGDESLLAQSAFSCLVKPELSDRVAFLVDQHADVFITHVLQRESENMSMDIPGNLDIEAGNGQLTIATSKRLNLLSGETCSLVANQIHTVASEADLNIKKVKARGESLDSKINEISVIADSISTVAGLLMQRVRNSIRAVEVLEKVDAGEMISNVKKLFSLRSKQTMLTAEQDVKIDGDRVHIG